MTDKGSGALDLGWLDGAKIFDLSHPYRNGMPQSPNHPPFRLLLDRRHGDVVRADGGSAANEMIVLGGHVGTHVDALAHVSQDGLLHGGQNASQIQSNRGFASLGIDEFPPYVGRSVLLDVAALHEVHCLAPGYEITAADLDAAVERLGTDINPGDVALIATGWSAHWDDPTMFNGQVNGAPGPGVDAARWLIERRPVAVGAETIAFEHIGAGMGHATLPVHRMMLVEHGINIIETMNLTELRANAAAEFLLVLNPLNVAGATGAPVRPLAIVA